MLLIHVLLMVGGTVAQTPTTAGQGGKCWKKNRTTTTTTTTLAAKPTNPVQNNNPGPNTAKPSPKPVTPASQSQNGPAPVAGDADGCITLQNKARLSLGLKPMAWDASLAASAQKWANHLNANNLGMVHSSGQGENLYKGSGECVGASRAWIDNERPLYAVGAPIDEWGDFHAYGHYTQVVYRDTNRAGCSVPHGNGGYFVCHYMPMQMKGKAAF